MKQRGGRMSISVNCSFYERLQAWCRENGVSVSALVDEVIADLGDGPLPEPPRGYMAPEQSRWRLERERVESDGRIVATTTHGQGAPRLSETITIEWPETVAELVYDSLPEAPTATVWTRTSSPLRPAEASTVLDSALVRMLDAYEAIAARASHCAVCRSKARPFTPKLAGESVVAVCRECMREGRELDGRARRCA